MYTNDYETLYNDNCDNGHDIDIRSYFDGILNIHKISCEKCGLYAISSETLSINDIIVQEVCETWPKCAQFDT